MRGYVFYPGPSTIKNFNNEIISATKKYLMVKNSQSLLYIKLIFLFAVFLILISSSIQTASADVVSVNTAGTGEIIVNPDQFIEGFFFGGLCGDGLIDSGLGETCDDSNLVSGDGCSNICQTEGVTIPPGGGGGGPSPVYLNITPTEFNIDLIVNTTTERTITVTNIGASQVVLKVSHGLGSHLIIENITLTISPGQTVNLNVVFVALREPGIFAGTITIGGETVLVSLNVKTQELLFDSNIIVLNRDYKVGKGDELRTRVTLIPLGDPERLDVGLFFTIRDYSGKIYLTKSETILVDRLSELDRNFDTGSLPTGDYVVGLELRYPNGVAPSSAHFEVVSPGRENIFGRLVLYIVSLILLILIIILIILIWRRLKEKIEESKLETSQGA